MKKTFFLWTCLFTMLLGACENSSTHLEFQGVPINGSMSSVSLGLTGKGYEVSYSSETSIELTGTFMDKPCAIGLSPSSYTGKMYELLILFTEGGDDWNTLKATYEEVVAYYTKEYGAPIEDSRGFFSPYSEGDGNEMQAIAEDMCDYITTFKTDKGEIVPQITSFGVTVFYTDAENYRLHKEAEANEGSSDEEN